MRRDFESGSGPGQPILHAPRVVVVLIALFVLVHGVRLVGGRLLDEEIVLALAFIPIRYQPELLEGEVLPGGQGAAVWSFVTHAFLHVDWVHLAVNSLWMLAFGSVLARRFGAWRFLAFSALAAAAGAAANLWLYWGKIIVLMGASGAISGQMAGAVRLIFADPRGLSGLGRSDLAAVRPLSLARTFRNRQALVFLAVWAGLTVVTGALNITPSSGDETIAWEAHAGGFFAGLLLFGIFDRRR